MPRGFTEQEKKNIELRLIKAAKEAFGRYGIKKTSVEELSLMAGISKGAFYQFFESKEELYFSVIRKFETEEKQHLFEIINSESEDEQATLKSVMKELLNRVESDFFLQRLLLKKEYEYLRQKLTPEQIEEALQADVDFASQLTEIWNRKGKLKIDDPDLISGVFRAIFFLYLQKEDIGPEKFSAVIDLLLDASIEKLIKK